MLVTCCLRSAFAVAVDCQLGFGNGLGGGELAAAFPGGAETIGAQLCLAAGQDLVVECPIFRRVRIL